MLVSQNATRPRATRREFITAAAIGALGTGLAERIKAGQDDISIAQKAYDYIIVGGGSAGCVLANRLSSKKDVSVLLLEAGGPDNDPRIAEFPFRYPGLIGSKFDWKYKTEPEPALGGRQVDWPRGKVMGGSSAINAMVYIRGHRLDYELWKREGNSGWGYQDVLPLFKRSETNEHFRDRYHGANGPLNIASAVPQKGRLGSAFLSAAKSLGYRGDPNWDFNGATQEDGAGYYQHNVKNGKRHSAAAAFLLPALSRKNLKALKWSLVTRVLMENRRVTGVEYVSNDWEVHTVRAKREVILCAGAVDSPQILLLSGIGPAVELKKHCIPTVLHLPGVGKNLQDHPAIWTQYLTEKRHLHTPKGSGPAAGLFVRSGLCAANEPPDMQIYFAEANDPKKDPPFAAGPSVFLGGNLATASSRGEIRLRTANPLDAPMIQAGYLRTQRDLKILVQLIEKCRQLAGSASFAPLLKKEHWPGPSRKSQQDLENSVREGLGTQFHPAGTCKMGKEKMAVVDERLRVRGIEGLRVADASIMPILVNGNTNAPCMMIGEKAADLIQP